MDSGRGVIMGQIVGYIYKITNKINGKSYVGQTTMKSIEDRIKCHLSAKMTIGDALRKYGLENFEVEELAKSNSIDKLNELETSFIEEFDTIKTGYNNRPGGRNYKLNKENIRTLQKAHKKQSKTVVQYDKDLNYVNEYFSISEAERLTGIYGTAISACCKKKTNNKSAGGFVWSYKGDDPRKPVISGRSIAQFTKSGEKVQEFPSMVEASKQTSIHRSNIAECCLGVRKTAGGHVWRYL